MLGLNGTELYLLGCLLDIIIFSSALGYRVKTMADEKNELVRKEAEARLAIEKTRTGIAMNLHDDIGSVLSSMSVYGEATKRALKENNVGKADELIEKWN
jgi:signal transduction histidine kinase